jgi:predicted Rossmann fold flavoprotein
MKDNPEQTFDLVIIGGGAAGFFTATNVAERNPSTRILILEQSKEVLNKVRISGGGRCNVTHACYEAKALATFYPRGHRELIGPFSRFGPQDTVDWFASHGVAIKTEADGRMFPETDMSQTIIDCFLNICQQYEVTVKTHSKVTDIKFIDEKSDTYTVITDEATYHCPTLVITAGSSPNIWRIMEQQGYEISTAVPSLFTFNLPYNPICALMGVAVQDATVHIKNTKTTTSGPLLITHWGLSGPAILKASSWGARDLADMNHKFDIIIDWAPKTSIDDITSLRTTYAKKKVVANAPTQMPSRLWHYKFEQLKINPDKQWADLTKIEMNNLVDTIKKDTYAVSGKTTFKEEFVTAGGVALSQVNFKTFGSKKHPNLYMAGEILDIDGVTGGFNFQAAWTGAHLVSEAILAQLMYS